MSHITRIKTKLLEEKFILKALVALGYEYTLGEQTIQGSDKKQYKVQIKIQMKKGYSIGLVAGKNGYTIVADWWGVYGVDQKKFTDQIKQQYAYQLTIEKLAEQGFELVNEEQDSVGIRLVLRRMA